MLYIHMCLSRLLRKQSNLYVRFLSEIILIMSVMYKIIDSTLD